MYHITHFSFEYNQKKILVGNLQIQRVVGEITAD